MLLPSQYSKHHVMAGRIGGLTRAARQTNEADRKEAAARARMRRYDALVPAEITDPDERARRRDLLLRADMTRLAKRSAEKRRSR